MLFTIACALFEFEILCLKRLTQSTYLPLNSFYNIDSKNDYHLDTILALLRLSTKYDFEGVRKEVMDLEVEEVLEEVLEAGEEAGEEDQTSGWHLQALDSP